MINNSTYLTKSCKCNNPNHKIVMTTTVKSGKNFGKTKYLIYCNNCKAQWWSFKKGEKDVED